MYEINMSIKVYPRFTPPKETVNQRTFIVNNNLKKFNKNRKKKNGPRSFVSLTCRLLPLSTSVDDNLPRRQCGLNLYLN